MTPPAGDERGRIVRALRDAASRLEREEAGASDLRKLSALASAIGDAVGTAPTSTALPVAVPRARLAHDLRSTSGTLLMWCYLFRQGGVNAEQAAHGLSVIEETIRRQLLLVERLEGAPPRPRGRASGSPAGAPASDAERAAVAPASDAYAAPTPSGAAPDRPPGGAEPTTASAAAHAPGSDLAGLRILIVDDDGDAREAMRAMLAAHGADVATAISAVDAFDVLQQGRPDLLISDIVMPDADGYALLRRVRAPDTGERGLIPAIAVTGRAGDRQRALGAGYQVQLTKPIEPEQLIAAVRALVGR